MELSQGQTRVDIDLARFDDSRRNVFPASFSRRHRTAYTFLNVELRRRAHCLTATRILWSFFQRQVRHVAFADVDLLRPENAVVFQLFEPVREPAGDAGDGENWCEYIAGNAKCLIDDAGIEIDVGIDALGSQYADGDFFKLD